MRWDRCRRICANTLAGRAQEMISPHYPMIGERTCDRRDPDALKFGVRPTVCAIRTTGRDCLWVSELQTAAPARNGLGGKPRRSCTRCSTTFMRRSAVLEHRWRKGDLIIWDNIALQHARGNLEGVGRRVLQRVIVGSEGVAPHVAAG
jgi:taurine dioxygenase